MASDSAYEGRAKKEVGRLERERKHLQQNLAGIKDMNGLPDLLFVIDSNKEAIAVKEARKLGIPVVAVVDTNCDPDEVDHVIPGNDDALRAIRLFTNKISDAVIEGRALATETDFSAEKIITDETPVEVRYPRSKQEEQGDREQWPWLPVTIIEQCGPDEWYVCVEVREAIVLKDRPKRLAEGQIGIAFGKGGTGNTGGLVGHRCDDVRVERHERRPSADGVKAR